MTKVRRLRPTVARQPSMGSPEGVRAAFWRENVLRLSRPALGSLVGITNQTVAKFEGMAVVPVWYRLACAALTSGVAFDWEKATAQVGKSTITFGEATPPGRGG